MNNTTSICHVHPDNRVECNNVDAVQREGDLILLKTSNTKHVIFVHDVSKTTVCQGHEFQVYVWGARKYVIWSIDSGTTPCVVFNDVYVDLCEDDVLAVSHVPQACNNVTLNNCENDLLEMLAQLDYPLVVLVGINKYLPILNAVNHERLSECVEKKNFIIKLRDEQGARLVR